MPNRKYLCEYTEPYLDKDLKTSKNSTKTTYKNYVITLKQFLSYSSNKFRKVSDKIKASALSFQLVFDFMTDTSKLKKWKPATWNVRLAGIKAFVRYLSMEDPWFIAVSYTHLTLPTKA